MGVATVGNRFPRYIIFYAGRCWTGTDWGEDEAKALLFADRATAEAEDERLLTQIQAHQHEVEIVLPVAITCITPWPVPAKELIELVQQVVRVACDDPVTPDVFISGIDARWEDATAGYDQRLLILAERTDNIGGPDERYNDAFHVAHTAWAEIRTLVEPPITEMTLTAERAFALGDALAEKLQGGDWEEKLKEWGDADGQVIWRLVYFLQAGGVKLECR